MACASLVTPATADDPQAAQTSANCCAAKPEKPAAPVPKYFLESLAFPHVTLELACVSERGKAEECGGRSPYPLKAGTPFAVLAKSSSGKPVAIKLSSGSARPTAGIDSLVAIPDTKGKLVFTARASPSDPGVTLGLEVGKGDDLPPVACAAWLPSAVELAPDAASIVSLLGNPKPLILEARGPDAIAIYSSEASPKNSAALLRITRAHALELRRTPAIELGLASRPVKSPFLVEFEIPHAAALGDLAERIAGLKDEQFSATNVGSHRIRLKADSYPSCEHWNDFLSELRELVWNLYPQPFSTRLFYLPAGDVSAAFKAISSGSPGKESPDAAASSAAGEAAKSPAKATAPASAASLSVASIAPDMLIFGDTHPGDDAAISEQRRLLAQLDLPRPEMIISAWVLQNSSTDGTSVGNFNDIVNRTVSANNEALQNGILSAWEYLKDAMNKADYFDALFFDYVVKRHVTNLPKAKDDTAGSAAESFLRNQPSAPVAEKQDSNLRERFGFCPSNQYCLGYVDLFRPLAPRLTDLLLAVVAAKDPLDAVCNAASHMENPSAPVPCPVTQNIEEKTGESSFGKAIKERLDLDREHKMTLQTCETQDLSALTSDVSPQRGSALKLNCFRETAAALFAGQRSSANSRVQPTPVGLLRAAIADFLYNYKLSQQYPHEFSAYELGRSADVLNSALRPIIDSFNRDVRTFQRFLGAELEVEVHEFNQKNKTKLFFRDKPSFLNNGLVTVRTISGQESTVNTISQSFLDASTAPQLADLAKTILSPATAANPGESASGSKPNPAAAASDILGHLLPLQVQFITGTLAAYQSSKVQIGRELSLDVTPRSLNGAVSAEINVKLNAGESAAPNYWQGTHKDNSADLSRVATHNTSTHIRVDSIKLFDVSAFSAVLQRARSRFPLLPPFVELPYIGTIVGVPLPPATEYHSSAALLSAIVVPTAADIASVAVFRPDAIVDRSDAPYCHWPGEPTDGYGHKPETICAIRRAISLADLDNQPVTEFHRAMIHCLATNQGAASWTRDGQPTITCEALTFDKVLHAAP